MDSVIDGLDGVTISSNKYKSSYDVETEVKNILSNIHNFNAEFKGSMSLEDELNLGRDFNNKVVEDVSKSAVSYDTTTGNTQLVFNNASGNVALTFEGTADKQEAIFLDDVDDYLEEVVRAKQNAVLAGDDPDTIKIGTPNLTEIVGVDKITTSGYFDDTVTITNSMVMSQGESGYSAGQTGGKYPTSYIDFSGMDATPPTYTINKLVGAGFNTTCKTCSNHYSIKFVDSIANGDTATDGYVYKKSKQGSNYTLEIDINSLKNKGIDTGKELAEAMVAITEEVYDFHYTQYAAEGSKLYVYDNRTASTGTRAATFNTYPHGAIDVTELSFELKSNDKTINLNYSYNFGDMKNFVDVEMVSNDASGKYVEVTDGSGNKSYEVFDSSKHASTLPRFDMKTTYKLSNGTEVDEDTFKETYVKDTINTLLKNTTVDIDAKDYSYISYSVDENSNVALRSVFGSELVAKKMDGIYIQCSSNSTDKIEIPRFALNTMDLKLYNASTATKEDAEKTINMTKEALHRLSEKRATYGVLQNRLEYAYNSNFNTEENTTAAESRIRDADMAKEMVAFSNFNVLQQVG